MNISATSRRIHGFACRATGRCTGTALLALAAGSIASGAFAEDDVGLEGRGEASFGGSLYFIDSPYDNDFLGGFWDQYRRTRRKNHDPAYFVDLLHFDLGLARDDDTYAVRVEGWSPNRTNRRVEVDGVFDGIGFDLDYRNFRSEELRYFPQGTFQDVNPPGPFPFATQYTPDASVAEILDQNRRLWIERSGVSGEIRLRPESLGSDLPVLDQISLRSGYERREGYRQDSFLLHSSESATSNRRFRGNRRRIDQEVTNIGSGFVLTPAEGVVADLDLSFESFREKAGAVTFADIAAADPSSIPAPSESLGLRAFNFVPDTDRLSGSLRVDTKIGRAAVQGGGFVTHLRQTNRAPLQRALELDRQQVTSWSAHGGFELALDHDLELMGTAKFSERRNGLDVNDLAGQQLGPILRRRSEFDTQVELSLRPQAGALVATGYRYEWIDRNLRYPEALLAVDEPVALITGRSESHNLYLRGRARLFRRLQVSGELGWEYRPQRDYPRDMTHSVYFDARGAYTLPRPIPISLSLQGGVRDGHGNGRVLTGSTSQARKDLDRLQWSYSATLTAVPASSTTLTLSFVQHQDDQETPYLRTDFPRTFGSGFTNFLPNPERVHYDSGVRSLSLGGRQKLTDSLEMRGFANLTWVEADLEGNNPTGTALDGVNEIRSRILSAGGSIGFVPRDGLRFDVGYRFDEYLDRRERGPIGQDDRRHSLHFGVTASLDLISGRAAD